MERARKTAFLAARKAGYLLKERIGKVKSLEYKGDFNIVTDVDKESERTIIDVLQQEFPDHAILAEESGAISGSACRWLIDPLDGTTNYAHAYPFFCVSIGLEDRGEMALGVVYNPITDELFWAENKRGAFLHQSPIKVSSVATVSASLLATGFPSDTRRAEASNMTQFSTLTDSSHGVRRDGSAALDLCFVACGRLDGFWEIKLSPWDMAAGSLIVREAGGKVTGLDGGSFDINRGHIVATNGLIHNEVVALLGSLANGQLEAASQASAREGK